ncbi:hypothetical protein B0H14DRAFT_3858833 [Mycena olivaceomarginata]|nr:hypothetical protein B0H14DRAFT_3858833 [Mycena olivaceomarginata]
MVCSTATRTAAPRGLSRRPPPALKRCARHPLRPPAPLAAQAKPVRHHRAARAPPRDSHAPLALSRRRTARARLTRFHRAPRPSASPLVLIRVPRRPAFPKKAVPAASIAYALHLHYTYDEALARRRSLLPRPPQRHSPAPLPITNVACVPCKSASFADALTLTPLRTPTFPAPCAAPFARRRTAYSTLATAFNATPSQEWAARA